MRIKKLTSKRERELRLSVDNSKVTQKADTSSDRHTKDIMYKKGNRRATWLLNTMYSLTLGMTSNTKHPCHLLSKCC